MTSFISIDVETANAFMGSVCQIGAVRFEQGRAVEHINWLIDPEDDFDEINVSIHGIDENMVRGQPSFADRYADLCSLARGSVMVCHTHFDRVALAQACAAAKCESLTCRWLDSARVARRAWPDVAHSGYGLASLANRFNIQFRHHDAAEDAHAAGLILLRAIKDTGLGLDDWLERVERSLSNGEKSVRRTGDGDGPLVGERMVFTGALTMPRQQAADIAHQLGAAVETVVTKNTTILVVGDQDLSKLAGQSKSSKHRKAEELISKGQQIRILAERDFIAFQ